MTFLPEWGSDEQLEEERSEKNWEISVHGSMPSTTLPFVRAIRATVEKVRRQPIMRLVHKAMKLVVESLQECKRIAVIVRTRELDKRKCVSPLVW